MKTLKKYLWIPCLILLAMASCKFSPDAVNVPNWEMNILGPLVNTSANGNKIVQMKTLKGSATFTLRQLGDTIMGNQTIPAIGPLPPIGPFHFELFNAFKSLTLETGTMYFNLKNNMPITLKLGTTVTIKDSISGDVLLSVPLASDVPPNTNYVYTTGVNLAGKTIESSLAITITNLSTGASSGAVNVNGSEGFEVDAFLENASMEGCVLNSDSAQFRDTSQFSLQGYKVKTSVTGGTITTFITNGLPFDVSLQFYFMKDDRLTIVDSLFDSGTFIQGRTSATQPSNDSILFTITDTKLKHMSDARYIVSSLKVLAIPDSGITLNKQDSMKMLLVGNLKVKLN